MVVGTWIACVTVLSLVTACPYTSATNLKYNSGVIIDKSFHQKHHRHSVIIIKKKLKVVESYRGGQLVTNHRLSYIIYNETMEYQKWYEMNVINETPTYDPYRDIVFPTGEIEEVVHLEDEVVYEIPLWNITITRSDIHSMMRAWIL